MKFRRPLNGFEGLQLLNNDQHAYNDESNKGELIIKNWYDKNVNRNSVYMVWIRV